MRKSVLTGVFACALVFVVSGGKSEAATIQKIEIENAGIELALMTEPEDNTLAVFSEYKKDKTKEVKKETPKINEHLVKQGESLSKIAKKYNVDWKRIFNKNTTIENPDQINPGIKLIIPEESENLEERAIPEPVVVARTVTTQSRRPANTPAVQSSTVSRGSSSGNGYVAGYCTWYVKNKRPDLPNNLGNAYTWVSRAAAQGIPTGSAPRVGAVGQRGNHVVYVESVNADSTVTISEMNHKGLYVQTVRTLPASYFSYIY